MKRIIFLLAALIASAASYAQLYTLSEKDVIVEGDSIRKYLWPTDEKNRTITQISIPSSIGGKTIKKIGAHSFDARTSRTSNRIEVVELQAGIEKIGDGAFRNNVISSISLPEGLTHICDSAFYFQYSSSGDEPYIECLEIPNSVTHIGASAFEDMYIQKLKLSSSLKTINARAFKLNELTELDLPEGLERIEVDAFSDNAITKYNIPSTLKVLGGFRRNGMEIDFLQIPSTVEEFGDFAFAENKIKTIEIPRNIHRIGERAFANCGLNCDLFIHAGIEYIGPCAFSGCSTALLQLEEGITTVNKSAFSGLYIDKVKWSSTLTVIESGAFENSFSYSRQETTPGSYVRTSLPLPSSLKKIGSDAFCAACVRSITVSGNNLEIADNAFSMCIYLKKLKIGRGVVSIGKKAFDGHETFRYLSVDMEEAVDLKHIMPGAFEDAVLGNVFILPKNGDWFAYTTDPDHADTSTPTTVLDDQTMGYVCRPTSAIKQIQTNDGQANTAVYDIAGRRLDGQAVLQRGLRIVKTQNGAHKIIVR